MKRMGKLIFITLFLTAVFLQGCSETAGPSGSINNYLIIPLGIGYKWDYNSSIYDTAGNVITSLNISNEIRGDTAIDNIKWFYFFKDAVYFSVLSDGYHQYDKYEPDSLRNTLVYKYPCNAGDKYSYYQVADVDTIITVPAGSFSCIKYSFRKQTLSEFGYADIFIKPEVGIVKILEYSFLDNHPIFLFRTQELVSYNFK